MQRRKIRQQRREIGLYVKEDSELFSKSVTSLGTSSLLNFHSVCIRSCNYLSNSAVFCCCFVLFVFWGEGMGVKSYRYFGPKDSGFFFLQDAQEIRERFVLLEFCPSNQRKLWKLLPCNQYACTISDIQGLNNKYITVYTNCFTC